MMMDDERRFDVTEPFWMDGLRWRIIVGKKRQKGTGELGHDRCLQWYSPELDRWIPISMRTVGYMTDFLFENEGYLYPGKKYAGGGKFKKFLWDSIQDGWESAWERLRDEQRKSRLFDDDEGQAA